MQLLTCFWQGHDQHSMYELSARYRSQAYRLKPFLLSAVLLMAGLLSGCQSVHEPGGLRSLFKKVELKAAAYLYTYEKAVKDFDAGRVMEAHETVLGMDKARPDYTQAKELFDKEIEPARKKLLRYYLRKAGQAEKKQQWAQAVDFYEQAVSFSPEDFDLAMQARELKLRMRQIRFDELLKQRRREDREIITWMDGYDPPPGLDPQDEVYLRKRENYQDWIGGHARDLLREARRHLRRDQPELAYVELESFLRFRPGDAVGEKLVEEAKDSIPQGLSIDVKQAKQENVVAKPVNLVPSKRHVIKLIEAKEIEVLVEQKRWSHARKLALAFRRQGGDHAEQYLDLIAEHAGREAAAASRKGSIAFRRERLDEAVEQWQRASDLEPDNDEYSEQLRRALRMQERLLVIRQEAEDKSDTREAANNGT